MFHVVHSRYYYVGSVIFIIAFIPYKLVLYFKPKKKDKLFIKFLSNIDQFYLHRKYFKLSV